MTPDEEIRRAKEAQRIVGHPLWAESWDDLTARLQRKWQESRSHEVELREMVYAQLRAAEAVRAAIEQIIVTGHMAEIQLERSGNGSS